MKNVYKELYVRSDKFDDYIKQSVDKTWNWTEGSIRAGKSVSNIAAFCLNLLASPEPLHLAIATTASAVKTILFDGNGLGIKYFFWGLAKESKHQGHESLVITINGQKKVIMAVGGQDAGSYKTFRGMSVGSVIFTEIDLIHPETIQEAINRTTASRRRRFFVDHNPTDPNHSIYSEEAQYSIERLRKVIPEEVNYMHATIFDNPSMTPQKIEEVLKEWNPDSVQYKRYILGQRVVAENLIYNVYDYNILQTFNPTDYVDYVVVADPGENMSATGFILMAITKGFTSVDVLKEYYHRNADQKLAGVKSTSQYADDLAVFLLECVDLMGGRWPRVIYTDLDISFQREFRTALNSRKLAHIGYKDAIKNEIDDRIKQGVSLLYTKKLRFHKSCDKTIESFKSATYDPNNVVKGKYVRFDRPDLGTMVDMVDATEYGFTHFLPHLYRK